MFEKKYGLDKVNVNYSSYTCTALHLSHVSLLYISKPHQQYFQEYGFLASPGRFSFIHDFFPSYNLNSERKVKDTKYQDFQN